jgi:ATP-dependent Lon protease
MDPVPATSGADFGASEAATIPGTLPVVPVRHLVLFPGVVISLNISQAATRKALEEALIQSKFVAIFTQKETHASDQGAAGLYDVGVVARVLKFIRQDDGSANIIVNVISRVARKETLPAPPYARVAIELLRSSRPSSADRNWQAIVEELRDRALQLFRLTPEASDQLVNQIKNLEDPGQLADVLANSIELDIAQRQELLEQTDVAKRVRSILERVSAQLEMARLRQKIHQDVSAHFTESQRRAYLREQMKTIQKELGESGAGVEQQSAELRRRIEDAGAPANVVAQAERELRRLNHINPSSPEFSIILTYVGTLGELPWKKLSQDNLDLARAQKILDRDHYDLEKVKRRIVEYFAVRQLNPTGQSPVLCFLGPPGVGKTSLGQSIADALGRRFVRVSLGGLRDEAEIRGHRRTYIGAMPGRIIQELRRAGTRNPVFMLDEIDKIGLDCEGDPASALLEVLDGRQNSAFVDHYLDLPFDLSQVMFIATANYMDDVPHALRDRMEVIRLPGYSDREKLEIARRFLVPRQLKETGLTSEQCRFESDALSMVINDYTREAGVRQLDRQIAAFCRHTATAIARKEAQGLTIDAKLVPVVLGPPFYIRETRLKTANPGVVTGLAWTPIGGEIMHIEALRYPGKGGVLLTGQIGSVMKESVHAALSLAKSRIRALGIDRDAFRDYDVHIHVPAGAVSKDGPSAGVAMFTAIASLFSKRTVRPDIAMTGEITLRGLVLPIGGLKEKILAAQRAGIPTVILPKLNEQDLAEIPAEITKKVNFVLVETVDEVLEAALKKEETKTKRK